MQTSVTAGRKLDSCTLLSNILSTCEFLRTLEKCQKNVHMALACLGTYCPAGFGV